MSGHSKFANIKHKKEKNDAAKGKIFTIIGREIAVAVKEGGPDPANNSKLAAVVAKAKANNMPNDRQQKPYCSQCKKCIYKRKRKHRNTGLCFLHVRPQRSDRDR